MCALQLTMLVESSYKTYDFLLAAGGRQEAAGSCPWWNWAVLMITVSCYGFVVFVFGATVAKHRFGTPQHGLYSDTMTLITSDCDAMQPASIKWP